MQILKRAFNAIKKTSGAQHALKKPAGKPIKLSMASKHDPFGQMNIDTIKMILEEEDFEQMQSLYFFMMRDLKIASVVLARRLPLLSLAYTVETENDAFKELLANKVDLSELINQMCSSIYYGVSLTEVNYTVSQQQLIPSFRLISPRYLHAHTENQELKTTAEHVYFKQNNSLDKIFLNTLDPAKAVFHKHAIDIGEITDFSLASKLVWYFSLKHTVMAHNLAFFDAVATPPLIAKTSGDNGAEIVDTLYDLKSLSVGVFDKEDDVSYLKIESKADFLEFMEYIDRQISTLVLGNTLSTGEGKNGSRSQSQTHENRQREILHFDATLIEKSITRYLTELEKLNFSESQVKGVRFKFELKEKRDLKELSDVLVNLAQAGFDVDALEMSEKFGFTLVKKDTPGTDKKPGQDKDDEAEKENNAQHSEHASACGCAHCVSHNKQTTTPIYNDTLDGHNHASVNVEKQLVNAIESTLKQANNFDEAYQLLLQNYADMPLETLEATLFKAIANSQLLAVAEVENER